MLELVSKNLLWRKPATKHEQNGRKYDEDLAGGTSCGASNLSKYLTSTDLGFFLRWRVEEERRKGLI